MCKGCPMLFTVSAWEDDRAVTQSSQRHRLFERSIQVDSQKHRLMRNTSTRVDKVFPYYLRETMKE